MKKTTLTIAMFIALLWANNAAAQCEELTMDTHDKVSGITTTSAKDYIIISKDKVNGIGILLMKSQQSVIMSAKVFGASPCVDDKAQMTVLFTDGTRTVITNGGKFNCDRKFTAYFFDPKDRNLLIFTEKTVETMRIQTYKGSVTEDVPLHQAEQLRETLKCLLK